MQHLIIGKYQMEWNSIIQLCLGVVVSVVGYLYRDVKTKSDATQLDLLAYKLHVSENFVSNDQLARAIEVFNSSIADVKAGVQRIETHMFMGQDRRRSEQ